VKECIAAEKVQPILSRHCCFALVSKLTKSADDGVLRAATSVARRGVRLLRGVSVFLVGGWKRKEATARGPIPDKKEVTQLLSNLGAVVLPSADAAMKVIKGRDHSHGVTKKVLFICEPGRSQGEGEKAGGLGSSALLSEVHNLLADGSSFVRVCSHSWLFDAISCFDGGLGFSKYAPENNTMKDLWEIGNLYDEGGCEEEDDGATATSGAGQDSEGEETY
jgi:hypothetical protein